MICNGLNWSRIWFYDEISDIDVEPSCSTTHSKFIAEMKFLNFAMLVKPEHEKSYFMHRLSTRKF
jgi:hypothetical protein